MPGREGALVGGEVESQRRHLLRLAESAHRLTVDELLADLFDRLAARAALRFDPPVERRALDRARADRVAAHAPADEVSGNRLGEADHCGLRGAVDVAV